MTSNELKEGPVWQVSTRIPMAVMKRRGWHVSTVELETGDKAEVLSGFARALSFPSHFGHNWDALADCLASLPPRRGYLVRVIGEIQDKETLIQIAKDAAETLASDGIVLRIVQDPGNPQGLSLKSKKVAFTRKGKLLVPMKPLD